MPGFKQTEAGLIPDTWEVRAVRELGEIKTGPFGTLLKAAEYSGGDGVPLISVGEVGFGSLRVTDHTPLVPAAVVRRLPQYVLRRGDIVFGRKGAVDRSALVSESQDGWFLGSDGMSIRPTAACHPPYLACQFQRYEVQTWLLQNATGTTMASLNQEVLSRVVIPYAPLPEQRAIAAALSDVDTLLTKLDQLITKKRDLKQAAMQQLLTGKTRLPGFSGEWETTTLRHAVATPITDGPHLTPKFLPTGVPFLSVNNLVDNRLDLSSLRYISLEDHIEFSKKCKPRRGDLLFGKAASVGMVALIETDMELNIWSPLALIRVAGSLHERFDFYALQTGAIGRQIKLLTNASSQGNIGMSDIGMLEIPVPSLSEQEAIAAVLSDMDAELAALEARRDKTRALKQGMMQELLTGRIRFV